jgi:hypothetical protein
LRARELSVNREDIAGCAVPHGCESARCRRRTRCDLNVGAVVDERVATRVRASGKKHTVRSALSTSEPDVPSEPSIRDGARPVADRDHVCDGHPGRRPSSQVGGIARMRL